MEKKNITKNKLELYCTVVPQLETKQTTKRKVRLGFCQSGLSGIVLLHQLTFNELFKY